MRILIVTPFITTKSRFGDFVHTGGGVAVRYENYETELKKAGHQVRVLCPNRHSVDTWVLKDDGYITASCMKGFPMNGLTPSNILRLVHCFRWCDVCIAPENEQMMTLALFSKLFRKRLVLNVHTNVHQMLATRPFLVPIANFVYYQFLRTALCSSLCKCYTVSDTNKKVMQSNGVVVDGVYELQTRKDLRIVTKEERDIIRSNLAPGKTHLPLILFAGRWLEEKRIHRLAETLPSNAALVIIGDGPLPLPTTLHDPSKNVFVHRGFLPNDKVYEVFQCVEWVANASDFETFGNTSFEGNSVGTPCILHPKGGHLSQIKNEGTNGYFVDFDLEDDVVRERIRGFVQNPPSKDVVKMNIVRKSDAVTVLDVVDPSRHTLKTHEQPTSNPIKAVYRITRTILFEEILKTIVLILGFLFNVTVVVSVALLAGFNNIPADTKEDRARRLKRKKKKRKRDVIKRFVQNNLKRGLNAIKSATPKFPSAPTTAKKSDHIRRD